VKATVMYGAGDVRVEQVADPELLPDVLEGRVQPGRVFDSTIGIDEVPEGYRAMNDRETIKAMVKP